MTGQGHMTSRQFSADMWLILDESPLSAEDWQQNLMVVVLMINRHLSVSPVKSAAKDEYISSPMPAPLGFERPPDL